MCIAEFVNYYLIKITKKKVIVCGGGRIPILCLTSYDYLNNNYCDIVCQKRPIAASEAEVLGVIFF